MNKFSIKIVLAVNDIEAVKSNGKANEYNFCQLYHFKSVEIQEVQETLIGCLWGGITHVKV